MTGTVATAIMDWRVPAVQDYYINKVIGESTYTDSNIDGVFVDSGYGIASWGNLTLSERQALMMA